MFIVVMHSLLAGLNLKTAFEPQSYTEFHRERQGKIFVLPLTYWVSCGAVESLCSTNLFGDFKTSTAGFKLKAAN